MLTGCVGTEAGTALTRSPPSVPAHPRHTSKLSSPQAASSTRRCPAQHQLHGSAQSRGQGNPTGSADPISLPLSALCQEKTQKSSWSDLERMVFLLLYL